jgi:hypothetical protein
MSDPMQSWWKLAQSLGDIAWHAPQVVQHRTARLLAAPGLKRARDRREAQKMVAEKFEAMFETQLALWQHAWTMQQRMAQQIWRSALSGSRPVRSSAGSRRSAAASLSLARRSLAPVRRRVKANSRRLRLR